MKDRMIKLVDKAKEEYVGDVTDHSETDYIVECLLNNGAILPPCRVGQTVYIIDEPDFEEPYVLDVKVNAVGEDERGIWVTLDLPLGLKQSQYISADSIGKTVFLTVEDAEKAIEERKIEQNKSLVPAVDFHEEVSKSDKPRQIGEKMICKECGSNMRLDDKDFNFKGNYDNYWCCENDNCLTSCIEQVRFNQSFKEEWHSENNNKVKDYVIKHYIKRPENPQNKPLDSVIKNCEDMSKNSGSRTEKDRTSKER